MSPHFIPFQPIHFNFTQSFRNPNIFYHFQLHCSLFFLYRAFSLSFTHILNQSPSITDLFSSLTNLLTTGTLCYESNLIDLTGDFLIVGDLHGHILDFLRILITFGMSPTRRHIFLGDLVHRGDFSIHQCLSVFLLKCVSPRDVSIIRGNHEFPEISAC
jgi:hypothetical protein